MENNCVIESKVTNKNIVLTIPKEFVLNDFDEMMEGFRVKGNRRNKFLNEFSELLVEHLINNESFVEIYDQLIDSENVKELEEDY